MPKIYVLSGSSSNAYTVVVHAPTPAGNNAAGTSWADALKNSGNAKSVLPLGTGAGQITQADLTLVESGAVMEGSFVWGDEPTWTNQQRTADLDLRANQLIAELMDRYQRQLKYFGFTRS